MPVYEWEGRDSRNRVQKRETEAPNEMAVRAALNRQGITPVSIKEKRKSVLSGVTLMKPRVKPADIVVFCKQFSTMIDAGLPLLKCLEIIHDQEKNATLKEMLHDMKSSVEGGRSFAEALAEHPKTFDALFVNMIIAGETGGILETILRRLSLTLEKAAKLRKEIKGALILPGVVFSIAVLITVFMLVAIIPAFAELFEGMGSALPLPTQLAIDLSNFLRQNILAMVVGFILLGLSYRQFGKTDKGRTMIDSVKLRLPVIGMLLKKANIASFTRTMGTMLGSGVGMLEALEVTSKTAGNVVIERAVLTVRKGVADGRGISEPLTEFSPDIFPDMVCSMITVGDETGSMDSTLEKIADFYDEEVDQAVAELKSLIEPITTVVLGGIIGGLAVAMYLPIFRMASTIE